jgi:hypothetical protein
MDAKDLGLAIKSVVLGLGGAVAGVAGGPAAAEGVAKADRGLDRLIGVEPPAEKGTRGERFDRADYGARSSAPSSGGPARETRPALAPERAKAPPDAEEASEPSLGDEQIATGFLQSLGWSSEKIQGILGGPQKEDKPDPKEPFRTFEVYGVQNGSVVPLMNVLERKDGSWHVRPGAQVRATDRSTIGMGLAGVPGRWNEFYPKHPPEEYGLHAGKAVLYWEPRRGRALAASAGLLSQVFGRNWRSTVYRMEEDHG